MSTPLLQDYFRQLEEYRIEYHNVELLLLMQVGSFYEAYEVDEPVQRGCAKLISHILRMHLTKKNGKLAPSESNPWMVGFPTYVLAKHLNRLNDEGYTVVVIDQQETSKPHRVLKGVYNPVIRMDSSEEDPEWMIERIVYGLHVDKYSVHSSSCQTRYLLSMVSVNMRTGAIHFMERDTHDFLRESVQFLMGFPIQELLMDWRGTLWKEEEKKEWTQKVESVLSCKLNSFLQVENPYPGSSDLSPSWTHFLRHVFSILPQEDLLFELNLQYHPSIVSVLYDCLTYIEKHDPILITQLQRPQYLQDSEHRSFFYNRDAFLELNILNLCERRKSFVEKKKQKTLWDLMSHSMSSLGKRYLMEILRHPCFQSVDLLRERQALLSEFIEHYQRPGRISTVDVDPCQPIPRMSDLEWQYLRWKRCKLSIRQVGVLLHSMSQMLPHLRMISSWKTSTQDLEYIFQEIQELWDLEALLSIHENQLSTNCLRKNNQELIQHDFQLEQIDLEISRLAERYKPWFRLQRTGMDTHFTGTLRKWETFQYDHMTHSLYEISRSKSTVKVSCPELDRYVKQFEEFFHQRQSLMEHCFWEQSEKLLHRYDSSFQWLLTQSAQWDCYFHLAVFFTNNSYCMPEHVDSSSTYHLFHVENLRHAIYEVIEPDELFVPYSFRMDSSPESTDPTGLLIYGINSSGKSTFLKSLGIAVWLSQCGLMVPASSFRHTLTDCLLTKIGTFDNLYLKHSTFVGEMCELHCILTKVTSHSLVLCDELTSGTETQSATGIVAACLFHFLSHSIPFLLTTHLHSVYSLPEISQHPKLRVCHFEISCPTTMITSSQEESLLIENIQLRYNRSLKDGMGEKTYGIEIAKSLHLPEAFIAHAFRFRDRMEIHVHNEKPLKVSKYNSKLVCRECFRCKSKQHLHTHHITPQKEWKQTSNNHAKHGLYNLVILCESCHQSLHQKKESSP